MRSVIVKFPGKPVEVKSVDAKYRVDCKSLILGDGDTLQFVEMPMRIGSSCFCMMCDEEGLIKGLDFNFYLPMEETGRGMIRVDKIVGNVVFMRYRWENPYEKELWDFCLEDVTEQDIATVKKMFDEGSALQKLIRFELNGGK